MVTCCVVILMILLVSCRDHWKRFGQNLGELGALLRHMVTHGQEPLWTGRDAMECLHQVDDGSVLATVESIAFVRSILSLYAQEICAGESKAFSFPTFLVFQ